jgi:UDP-N-acetylglucosamine 2-epimerase
LRDTTGRPEPVVLCVSRLVGVEPEVLARQVAELCTHREAFARMAKLGFSYSDGHAAERIGNG